MHEEHRGDSAAIADEIRWCWVGGYKKGTAKMVKLAMGPGRAEQIQPDLLRIYPIRSFTRPSLYNVVRAHSNNRTRIRTRTKCEHGL